MGGLLVDVVKEAAKADLSSLVKNCPPILNPVCYSMEILINNTVTSSNCSNHLRLN